MIVGLKKKNKNRRWCSGLPVMTESVVLKLCVVFKAFVTSLGLAYAMHESTNNFGLI